MIEFVIVENPGMADERQACWTRYERKSKALGVMRDMAEIEALLSGEDFCEVVGRFDVMGVRADGSWTTEI